MSHLYEEGNFYRALWKGDMDSVTKYLKLFGPNYVFTDREDVDLTPLMIAACTNNTCLASLLLSAGSQPDSKCREYASFYKNEDVLEMLL